MSDSPRYEFGAAAEDRTLLVGLTSGQVAVVATGLLAAVATVRTAPTATGFAGAVVVLTAAALAAFWPVAGRTAVEWLPVAARDLAVRVTGRRRRLSEVPLAGQTDGTSAPDPPDSLDGVRILSAPLQGGSGREVAVVHDRRGGTYAAVLRVRGRSFQLADGAEKHRRLDSWGSVLAGLARASSPVHRLQWVERTVPEDGDQLGRYLAEHRTVDPDAASLASYLDLVDHAGPAAPRHETFLVVSVSARQASRQIRQAGGGDQGAAKVLLRELVSLRRKLDGADIVVDGVLPPASLAAVVRSAFEPSARRRMARRAAAAGEPEPGCEEASAWPLACETTWASYRTEDAHHATFWVAHWPRTPVGPDFLAPLLLGTAGTRSVSVTMQPVSPLQAHREVEQAVVKQHTDAELRSRAGFLTSARRRRQAEAVARREQELADGHADYRLAGYVTVTADSAEQLEIACGEVEQAAQQSFLELRRLYGQQDVAFTWTLPLARGLDG